MTMVASFIIRITLITCSCQSFILRIPKSGVVSSSRTNLYKIPITKASFSSTTLLFASDEQQEKGPKDDPIRLHPVVRILKGLNEKLFLKRVWPRFPFRNALIDESPPLEEQQSLETAEAQNTTGEKKADTMAQPKGSRWAISSNTTDLSGKWKPIITAKFKKEYDEYLRNCSQSFLFRNLCLSVVGLTREEIRQQHHGRKLVITGTSPAGSWERILVSSGADWDHADYEPFNVTFLDPDADNVNVEAWRENNGTVHKSWLRGKPRVCGGVFESTRYLDDDFLVCESVFHPNGAQQDFIPAG